MSGGYWFQPSRQTRDVKRVITVYSRGKYRTENVYTRYEWIPDVGWVQVPCNRLPQMVFVLNDANKGLDMAANVRPGDEKTRGYLAGLARRFAAIWPDVKESSK